MNVSRLEDADGQTFAIRAPPANGLALLTPSAYQARPISDS